MRRALAIVALPVLACAAQGPAGGAPPPPPPASAPGAEQAPPIPAEETANGDIYPPAESGTPPPEAATPRGQWVQTDEYGWLWIPYDAEYTYVPPDPQIFPEQYVYYPAYGWRWVVAPWVYGYGPAPQWGPRGPTYFAWYTHPWFAVGGYWGWGGYRSWGPYDGWVGPHRWGAHGWASAPSYYRSGAGGRPPPQHAARTGPAPVRGRAGHEDGHRGR